MGLLTSEPSTASLVERSGGGLVKGGQKMFMPGDEALLTIIQDRRRSQKRPSPHFCRHFNANEQKVKRP